MPYCIGLASRQTTSIVMDSYDVASLTVPRVFRIFCVYLIEAHFRPTTPLTTSSRSEEHAILVTIQAQGRARDASWLSLIFVGACVSWTHEEISGQKCLCQLRKKTMSSRDVEFTSRATSRFGSRKLLCAPRPFESRLTEYMLGRRSSCNFAYSLSWFDPGGYMLCVHVVAEWNFTLFPRKNRLRIMSGACCVMLGSTVDTVPWRWSRIRARILLRSLGSSTLQTSMEAY